MTTYNHQRLFWFFVLVVGIGLAAGMVGHLSGQDGSYHLSRQVPLGLLMAEYSFLLGLAVGCCILAAMSRFYGLTSLRCWQQRAVWLSLSCSLAAFFLLCFMVANPWRLLVHNVISPNLTANLWWLLTLSGIMTGAMFLEFVVLGQEEPPARYLFGFVGAVAAVGASNNLAAFFNQTLAAPLWFGGQQLSFFLATTLLTAGCLVLLCRPAKAGRAERAATATLRFIVQIMLTAVIAMYGVRFVTIWRAAADPGHEAARMLLGGELRWYFWGGEIGCGLVLPILLFSRRGGSGWREKAALLGMLAGVLMGRYNLLLAGQLTPKLRFWQAGQGVAYWPSVVEVLIALGGLAVVCCGIVLLATGAGLRTASQPARKPF